MNNTQKMILLAGIPALLCAACCGLAGFGTVLYKQEVCAHLATLEGIKDKVGAPLTTCKVDYGTTLNIDDTDVWAFDVTGSKGSGKVYVNSESDSDGNEKFLGTMLVIGGEEHLLEGTRPPMK